MGFPPYSLQKGRDNKKRQGQLVERRGRHNANKEQEDKTGFEVVEGALKGFSLGGVGSDVILFVRK